MYSQVGCEKYSCRVPPESEQPTVLRCKMKVEELDSSEVLQIKIEDVNSLGLEEEQSDQTNDLFLKVEVKAEHDIDVHLDRPEPNDAEDSFFKNHPHEGESTESTRATELAGINGADTRLQHLPTETKKRTFYKQDTPNHEMLEENNFYKTDKGNKGGGPAPKEPSPLSQKIAAILGEDDSTIHGIEGGVDSELMGENAKEKSTSSSSSSSCTTNETSLNTDPIPMNEIDSEVRGPSPPPSVAVFNFTKSSGSRPTSTLPNPCPPAVVPAERTKKQMLDENNGLIEMQKRTLVLGEAKGET
uniref:uncharacterized protein isoform X1 n=2 Tax=Myxine glutinosa TaxID=7769 RepID=UPI00358F1344